MAKNKLSDLNDHLFAALERLNDEELTPEKILSESKRVESIIGISTQILANAKITLDAMKLVAEGKMENTELPHTFIIKSE